MYMKVDTTTIIEYATTIRWTPKPLVFLEIARSLIKGSIEEKDARFVPIQALNNCLKSKWFVRTARRVLAMRNELYRDYNVLSWAHAIAVSYWSGVGPTLSGIGVKLCSCRK